MSLLQRAELLLRQNKYDMAEKEISLHLAENPNDGIAHSYLALARVGQRKIPKAIESAKQGVGLEPDSAYAHYILSKCFHENNEFENALESSKAVLSLMPEDADYLCNHAGILLSLSKAGEALPLVDQALEIDPEHGHAKKVKAMCLRGLGRYDEADMYASQALEEEPENAAAFVTKGMSLLDKGETKQALEHFKSAIMLDPTSEYAKSGLVLGLKAQNKLFYWFYKYYTWLGNLSSGARWGFIIGIYVLVQVIDSMSESAPTLAPLFNIIVALYVLFVFLSWTIDSIFTMFLRFNSYGKHALNRGEAIGANIMAILLGGAVLQFVLTLILPTYPLSGALGFLFLTLPVTGAFGRWGMPSFKKHAVYAGLLAVLLFVDTVLALGGVNSLLLYYVVMIGCVAYTWVSQFLK